MTDPTIPRIASAACDATGPFRLRVLWLDGQETAVDLQSHFARFKLYRPIRRGDLRFDLVSVGEYGTDLVWTDEIDISAETVWRLAQEQQLEARHAQQPYAAS